MRSLSTLLMTSSLIVSMTMLTGCASIVDGTHEKITIKTTPNSGATCTLKNDKGSWCLSSTPGTVIVHKSFQDLVITAQQPGYQTKTITVSSKTGSTVFGNFILGGGVGAGVDCLDGAAYAYPQTIVIPMQPVNQK